MGTNLWRKLASKLLELFQVLPYINCAFSIEKKGYNGLSTASILYCLRREEEVICRLVVVGTVFGCTRRCFARGIFEEEDDAVYCAELL